MKNVYLFQVQNLTTDGSGKNMAWLPYAVARLWAYAGSFDNIKENFQLKKIFPIRKPMDEILSQLENPEVCGFGTYVWNFNYNIELAEQIKQRWPNCRILFGGPSVTSNSINEFPIIDTTVDGEGEVLFKKYLEDVITGTTKSHYTKERVRDLSELVSPFATNVFDQVFEDNPDHIWSTSLETSRGCPYQCTFCDWGSVTNSKIFLFHLDIIKSELDWIKDRKSVVQNITLADANFGIFKDRDLTVAKMIKEIGLPGTVIASWSKVYNDQLPEIYNIIGSLGRGITVISIQTTNAETLAAIKRKNLDDADIIKLLESGRENNISINHEYILGLPLETKQSWYKSVTDFLDCGYNRMQLVYFCALLPNTELASPETVEKYQIKTVKTIETDSMFNNTNDVAEYSEIIKSTSTMTTEELIDCYVFSILLVHTYNIGYTRAVFMIANKNFSVSGVDFYSQLEHLMCQDPEFKSHIELVKVFLREILYNGSVTDPRFQRGLRIDHMSYTFFFKHKNKILDMAMQVFTNLSQCDDEDYLNEVKKTQYSYSFDLTQPKEQEIESKFDFNTFLPKNTKYKIKHKIDKKEFIKNFRNTEMSFFQLSQTLINEVEEITKTIPIISS
jgi:putative methyltransferase